MKKHTLEYVKNFFISKGCECLAQEYNNSMTKMPYRCICKNEAVITFNHFKSGERCYKCRKSIIRKNLPDLTKSQKDIIIGSLLGDAWLQLPTKSNHNSSFSKSQSYEKEEYIKWHFESLQPYSSSIYFRKIPAKEWSNGYFVKETSSFTILTRSCPYFTDLRNKWYPDEKDKQGYIIKKVPKDIEINQQVLAVWYADDGNNATSKNQITLHTEGFLSEDIDFLIAKLDTLGLKFKKHKKNECEKIGCGYQIQSSTDSYFDFLEYVKPFFPWKCFEYKIQKGNRKHYKELLDRNTSGYKGVSWDRFRNKWRATIDVQLKHINLGRFDTIEEAISARNAAIIKYGCPKPGSEW